MVITTVLQGASEWPGGSHGRVLLYWQGEHVMHVPGGSVKSISCHAPLAYVVAMGTFMLLLAVHKYLTRS